MTIALIRVDDRLIHGQVIMGWTRSLGVEHIIAADDATAKNPMQRSLLQMAAPAGIAASIVSVDEAADAILAGTDSRRTLVLVREPLSLLRLRERGVPFDHVNVGNVGSRPGRERLTREVHATPEELEAWRSLVDAGIDLEAQWLPDQPRTDLGPIVTGAG